MNTTMPPGWVLAAVSEVGRVQLGRQRSPEYHHGTHMRPYLRVANVFEDRIDITDVMHMHFDPGEAARYELMPGDILLNEGQSKELIGRPAMYRGELPGGCFTNSLVRFKASAAVEPAFALHCFRHWLHNGTFQKIAQITTNIAHLGAGRFATMQFPLPPLPEQRRIVAKLEALQARSRRAREALEAIPPLLDKFRQSVLAAAFRGDLTADWRAAHPDVEPASVLLERIRAERRLRWEEGELAKMRAKGKAPRDERWKEGYEEPEAMGGNIPWPIPGTWQWVSISTLADVLLGRQRAPQFLTGRHFRPYLRVANVFESGITYSDIKEMDFDERDFAKYCLRAGDILMSEGQSPELVGESAVYDGRIKGLCFQKTLHRLRPVAGGPSSEFLQKGFMCLRGREVFRRFASLTTSMAHLTLARVKTVPFPLPPAPEQQVILRRVTGAFDFAARVQTSVDAASPTARTLDRSILAKAFSGQLVPQDPGDEPASVLLAQVHAEREVVGRAKSEVTSAITEAPPRHHPLAGEALDRYLLINGALHDDETAKHARPAGRTDQDLLPGTCSSGGRRTDSS